MKTFLLGFAGALFALLSVGFAAKRVAGVPNIPTIILDGFTIPQANVIRINSVSSAGQPWPHFLCWADKGEVDCSLSIENQTVVTK